MLTLLPDLNIAPLRYAHVMREHGGPISSIDCARAPTGFVAHASLDSGLSGTGHFTDRPGAILRAISSAMEQWAWHGASSLPGLGMEIDPSPLGFAAFPGLGSQGARKRALFRAAERWTLRAWREGRIPVRAGEGFLELRAGIQGVHCCVVLAENLMGAGCSHSQGAALARARRALTLHPLPFFREAPPAFSGSAPPASLVVDAAVPGPWQSYAHVWRCLFDATVFERPDPFCTGGTL